MTLEEDLQESGYFFENGTKYNKPPLEKDNTREVYIFENGSVYKEK